MMKVCIVVVGVITAVAKSGVVCDDGVLMGVAVAAGVGTASLFSPGTIIQADMMKSKLTKSQIKRRCIR